MAQQSGTTAEKEKVTLATVKSRHGRQMNSQRGKRNTLSSRKFSQNDGAAESAAEYEGGVVAQNATLNPTYDHPPANVSKS